MRTARTRFELAPLVGACALVLLAGCSSGGTAIVDARPGPEASPDSGGRCALTIAAINGRATDGIDELAAADDQDVDGAGIQLEVEVRGAQLDDGTEVTLAVTRLGDAPRVRASGGRARFARVTVAGDLDEVLLQARARGCADGPELRLPVNPAPECFFIDPPDGASLSAADDLDPDSATFEYDVLIGTTGGDGATLRLEVGQASAGSRQLDAKGQGFFPGTTLAVGERIALTGRIKRGTVERRCQATISISAGLPACAVTLSPAPVPTPAGGLGIGVANDADLATPGMQANVDVTTGPLVDEVTLHIDGLPRRTALALNGRARFAAVPLPEGTSSLLAACAERRGGNVGVSPTVTMLVDSVAPDKPGGLDCQLIDRRAGTARCCWTSIGDREIDGALGGTGVVRYELRYSTTGPLTAANWQAGSVAGQLPAPGPGQPVCLDVDGLQPGKGYGFGLRASDGVENPSPVAQPPITPLSVDLTKSTHAGPNVNSAWGERTAAGDFNCDGHTDLAVGDPLDNGGRGRVAIYVGGKAGLPARPTQSIVGTLAGGQLGQAVATLPGFDADPAGCTDLAVLAAHGDTSAARVYLYLGRPSLIQRSDVAAGSAAERVYRLATGPGAPGGRIIGVAGAGDVDGDGAADLALAYHDDAGDKAEVWIALGDKALTPSLAGPPAEVSVPTEAGVRLLGGTVSEGFGRTLCGGGSLDGDGFADLLIGAPEREQGGQPRGAVHVLRGGPRPSLLPDNLTLTGGRVTTIEGGPGNGAFGHALAVVGDMDGDQTIEVAASDPSVDGDHGAVYLFRIGGAKPPATTSNALATIPGNLPGVGAPRLGVGLACVTAAPAATASVDLNNDGLADLVVGVEALASGFGGALRLDGASPLPSFSAASPGYTFTAPPGSMDLGARVTIADDIDGDGFADLILGDAAHDSGRGRIVVYR